MNNNLIVDDLKITVIPEMLTALEELASYKTTKHKDDITTFNYSCIATLWRRMENGKSVCLEAKQVK